MNLTRPRQSLAEYFDAEARQNGLVTLSAADASAPDAMAVKQANAPLPTRDAQGRVDMAAVFENEHRAGIKTLSAAGASAPDAMAVNQANAPGEMLLMPWGAQPDPLSYIVVDDTTLSTLPKMQSALDVVIVPIFDPGDPTLQERSKDPIEAPSQAGTGRVVVRDGEGIFLTDLNFTDDGLKALAEFSYICPTVYLQGDLATDGQKSVVGIKSVTFCGAPNQFTFLDAPKFVNLSAVANFNCHERMVRAFDLENAGVKDFKSVNDKASLVKLLSCTGHPPLKPEGGTFTAEELHQLPISTLKMLAANCGGIRFA